MVEADEEDEKKTVKTKEDDGKKIKNKVTFEGVDVKLSSLVEDCTTRSTRSDHQRQQK